MSDEIVNAYIEKSGTLEEWKGNREGWYAGLGAFTIGWNARKEWEYNGVEEAVQKIIDWKDKAYPLDIFPEPDLKRAHELLQTGGMVIDTVSASNIRFALGRVCEILDDALKQRL